jgi:hypothetical protein
MGIYIQQCRVNISATLWDTMGTFTGYIATGQPGCDGWVNGEEVNVEPERVAFFGSALFFLPGNIFWQIR